MPYIPPRYRNAILVFAERAEVALAAKERAEQRYQVVKDSVHRLAAIAQQQSDILCGNKKRIAELELALKEKEITKPDVEHVAKLLEISEKRLAQAEATVARVQGEWQHYYENKISSLEAQIAALKLLK